MKKFSSIIIFSLLLGLLFQTAVFADEYTREEKYGIERSWIEQLSDGSLAARWSETLYSTKFTVEIKRNDRVIFRETTVSGNEYDISELVYEKGKGVYAFTVFPKSGGTALSLTSTDFEVDNAVYNALSRCMNNRKIQRIENTKTVNSIDLRLSEKRVKAGEVRPVSFSDGSYFVVRSVTYSVPEANWQPGMTVLITLALEPKEGYAFSDSLKVSCSKAEKVSVSGGGASAKVTLTYIPYAALAKPHLLYVNDDGVLFWERVEHAQCYMISVKEAGEEIDKLTVKDLKVDLSEYIPGAGAISLEIWSNAGTNSYNYVDSSKIKIENLENFLAEYLMDGTFERGSRGWQYTSGGGEDVRGWKKLGQDWYYFDENGYVRRPGWFMDRDGSWYYFRDNGRALASQWFMDKDGSWYYFGDDCRMFVSRTTPDGYTVGADGRWIP